MAIMTVRTIATVMKTATDTVAMANSIVLTMIDTTTALRVMAAPFTTVDGQEGWTRSNRPLFEGTCIVPKTSVAPKSARAPTSKATPPAQAGCALQELSEEQCER